MRNRILRDRSRIKFEITTDSLALLLEVNRAS